MNNQHAPVHGRRERQKGVGMRLSAIRDLLDCEVLTGAQFLDTEVDTTVASDAMSAVLASPHPQALLITGLTNIQSVRTALIAYVSAIVYVRGSRPNETTIELASTRKLVLLSTALNMFDSCGILYSHGIKGAG
jgi:predicted transcriptional regulator